MHHFRTSAQHSYVRQWAARATFPNVKTHLPAQDSHFILVLLPQPVEHPSQSNEKYFAPLTIKFLTHSKSPTVFCLRNLQ